MEDKKSLLYFRLITEFFHHENNLSFFADCPYLMAQSIFDTYQTNDRVTYVSISPQMFSMLAKLNINVEDPEAQEFIELVTQIKTFKLLRTDDPRYFCDFFRLDTYLCQGE